MKTCEDCQNFPEEPDSRGNYICRRKLSPRDKKSHACKDFKEKETKKKTGMPGKEEKEIDLYELKNEADSVEAEFNSILSYFQSKSREKRSNCNEVKERLGIYANVIETQVTIVLTRGVMTGDDQVIKNITTIVSMFRKQAESTGDLPSDFCKHYLVLLKDFSKEINRHYNKLIAEVFEKNK